MKTFPILNNPTMPLRNKHRHQVELAANYDDGYLRIEYDNYFVSCNGQRLKMPRAEFLILSRLSQSPSRIVSYEDLWDFAWGDGRPVGTESLKVYIYHLRRIFKPFGIEFETMVNVGYRFVPRSSAGS